MLSSRRALVSAVLLVFAAGCGGGEPAGNPPPVPCTPSCDGTRCGGDGCGGTCACPEGLACQQEACVAQACTNGAKDPAESDADCGGACAPCADGRACAAAADCASHSCRAGVCDPTCAAANGGCSLDAVCANDPAGRLCTCRPGYEGDGLTCTDVDECASGNGGCDPHAACANTPGSRTCTCNPGWEGDGIACADADECLVDNGGCDANAVCSNEEGGRSCACKPGFDGDGVACVDVDECLAANGGCDAHAICENTVGSRTCTCASGWSGDGLTCADVDECLTANGGCDPHATCENTAGSRTCACASGWSGDGLTCADVDECLIDRGGCDSHATCENTAGARTCTCDAGWQGDGLTCADLDECFTANGGCDAHAICENAVGSRTCTCASGWSGDGLTCADVDECLVSNGGCDGNATCTNLPGTRSCACDDGWQGDGLSCTDLNECLTANGGCDANADCANLEGSRACTCKAGWQGDGETCTDIDECLVDNGGCAPLAKCTNLPGGRDCGCPAGYTGDGVTCTDINECLTANGGCDSHATCTNVPGSRTCACRAGWEGDGVSCTDIDECLTNNGGCGAWGTCVNTPGSRTCTCFGGTTGTVCEFCLTGYVRAGDGECLKTCAALFCPAKQHCVDTALPASCVCSVGYVDPATGCTACAAGFVADGAGACAPVVPVGSTHLAAVRYRGEDAIAALDVTASPPKATPLRAVGATHLAADTSAHRLYIVRSTSGNFGQLELSTGVFSPLINYAYPAAYDPTRNNLYFLATTYPPQLRRLANMVLPATTIGSISAMVMPSGLAFDPPTSQLVALEMWGFSNILWRIDPTNAAATRLGTLPIISGRNSIGGATVDPATGNYWIVTQVGRDDDGIRADYCREQARRLGLTGYDEAPLNVPYQYNGVGAGKTYTITSTLASGKEIVGFASYGQRNATRATLKIDTRNPDAFVCMETYEEVVELRVASTAQFAAAVYSGYQPNLTAAVEAGYPTPPQPTVHVLRPPSASPTLSAYPQVIRLYDSRQWADRRLLMHADTGNATDANAPFRLIEVDRSSLAVLRTLTFPDSELTGALSGVP